MSDKVTPRFVIRAYVKKYIMDRGLYSTLDVSTELNKQVAMLLDHAIRRCKQNRRSTVQPKDF